MLYSSSVHIYIYKSIGNQISVFIYLVVILASNLSKKYRKSLFTPFLPGIAHSQFNKFNVPSGFLVGLATKPYKGK